MAIIVDNDNNRVKYIPRPEDMYIHIDMGTVSSLSYSKEKVETFLNHLLSKQKHFIGGGSYISSEEFIKESNKFGFMLNPEGKDINE